MLGGIARRVGRRLLASIPALLGVVIVTTATVFWLFLLPTTIKGEAASPYIGILSYMGLPTVFFLGLFLIPVGIWLRNRREHRTGIYPASFPPPAPAGGPASSYTSSLILSHPTCARGASARAGDSSGRLWPSYHGEEAS